MIDALYIVGAVASILGAFYSWRQAASAKRYAEKAGSQFARHRRSSDLSHLKNLWDSTYAVLAIFGACARPVDLRGRNTAEAARKAQDYLTAVMDRRSSLQTILDLSNRHITLTKLLSNFSSARNTNDMRGHGTDLLNGLGDLNAAVCAALNKEMETVDLT